MKISAVVATGKWLMKLSGFRITIIDDQDAYFNDSMLNAAKAIGFNKIERLYRVDQPTLQRLLNDPPHILVLDIKGVSDRDVAKDGLALCALFKKNTPCYVAVPSAHRFHLTSQSTQADYVIEDRTLTTADFLEQIQLMTQGYLTRRSAFYKMILLRIGLAITRTSLTQANY